MATTNTKAVQVLLTVKQGDIDPNDRFTVFFHIDPANPAFIASRISGGTGADLAASVKFNDPNYGLIDGVGNFVQRTFYVHPDAGLFYLDIVESAKCLDQRSNLQAASDCTLCQYDPDAVSNSASILYTDCNGVVQDHPFAPGEQRCVAGYGCPSPLINRGGCDF